MAGLTQTFTAWLIDWLVDWLIDRLIDWLIGWSIGRLIDWLIDWFFGCLIDWLIVRLIDWLIDCSLDWLIRWSGVVWKVFFLQSQTCWTARILLACHGTTPGLVHGAYPHAIRLGILSKNGMLARFVVVLVRKNVHRKILPFSHCVCHVDFSFVWI